MEEDDQLNEMYGVDPDLTVPRPMPAVRVFGNSQVSEVEIDGKKFFTVNPQAIVRIENLIRSLQTKVSVLEQDLRTMRARIGNTEISLHEARQELANKISYE